MRLMLLFLSDTQQCSLIQNSISDFSQNDTPPALYVFGELGCLRMLYQVALLTGTIFNTSFNLSNCISVLSYRVSTDIFGC